MNSLTNEEILEGNKMIAEFMGVSVTNEVKNNSVYPSKSIATAKANLVKPFIYIKDGFSHVHEGDNLSQIQYEIACKVWSRIKNEAKYHSSWDWLIPAWSKIANEYRSAVAKPEITHDEVKQNYIRPLDAFESAVFQNKPEQAFEVAVTMLNKLTRLS